MIKNQDPKNPLRIVFFGTSEFAVPGLKYLIQNGYKISAVITQPEKPKGRQRITMPSPVKKAALENNISVLELHNLKEEDVFKKFRDLASDICIVSAYGKIIPSRYLEVPKYGFINIHPSILPKYRGPSPIQTSIVSGDKETGVTILKVDKEVDHGQILEIRKYLVDSKKYYKEIEKELAELGGELLLEVLPKYIIGEVKLEDQDHSKATFTKILARNDGMIDWERSAEEIHNQIRALNPEPGTWTTWNNKVLNIKLAEPLTLDTGKSKTGTVEKMNGSVVVKTKKHYLAVKQVQLEGKKEMDINSFLNGHPDLIGSKLG